MAVADSREGDANVVLDAATLIARARLELVPLDSAEQQLAAIPAGTVMTVTCSPKHGIDRTLAFAKRLRARGFAVVPHIAARGVRDADHLAQIAEEVRDSAIEEILVIGGDRAEPLGPYVDAGGLLQDLAPRLDGVRMGIAGYPGGHPAIADEDLTAALLSKQPVASVIVTQMCFDPAAIVGWVRSIRAAGVMLPALVGVPGVVDRRKLIELSLRLGVGDSTRFLRSNLSVATMLLRRSAYRPDKLIDEIASTTGGLGVVGLHIFTFNQLAATTAWRANTNSRRRQP